MAVSVSLSSVTKETRPSAEDVGEVGLGFEEYEPNECCA